MWTTGLVILAVALHLPSTSLVRSPRFFYHLDCYQCTAVPQVADCKSIVQCPDGYNCHATFKSNRYTLGCMAKALCPTAISSSVNGGSGTIVGRTVTRFVQDGCIQCCNTSSCNRQLCQSNVNGGLSDWAAWSKCSVSCGVGFRRRHRSCSNPSPLNSGDNCFGDTKEDEICVMGGCIDGGWSDWGNWGTCTTSCDGGFQSRSRTCTNPSPSLLGKPCNGDTNQVQQCSSRACANGGWSDWDSWGTCTTSCDGGLQSRSRTCTNPSPSLLGNPCTGDSNQVQQCSLTACDNGQWAVWGSWSGCSQTCDHGVEKRSRSCTNPPPSSFGKACSGDPLDVRTCVLRSCKDGGWTDWGSWDTCTTSCDGGLQSRSRTCTNPSPSLLGKPCTGDSNKVQQCSLTACANGGWSGWGSWGTCTTSCDGGLQSRSRTCTNPSPSLLGNPCPGETNQVQQCSMTACANGKWADWGSWSGCSQTCDHGVAKRSRSCTNPPPSIRGKSCSGDPQDVRTCFLRSCKDERIGFTADSPLDIGTSGGIKFTRVVTNEGGAYSSSTGDFTCPVSGVYFFNLNLLKDDSSVHSASCYIYRNSDKLVYTITRPDSGGRIGNYEASTSVYVHLSAGDTVHLLDCTGHSSMIRLSSFSGFLINAD